MCACTRNLRRSTWTASTASHRGLTASQGAALVPQMVCFCTLCTFSKPLTPNLMSSLPGTTAWQVLLRDAAEAKSLGFCLIEASLSACHMVWQERRPCFSSCVGGGDVTIVCRWDRRTPRAQHTSVARPLAAHAGTGSLTLGHVTPFHNIFDCRLCVSCEK